MNPKSSSPRDRLLDVSVFAPLGFVLQRDDVVQDLAAAGRRQVAFTRSLGRAALKGLVASAKASQPKSSSPEVANDPKPVSSAEIANFDGLTARQIVALARDASPEQLLWIQDRELAGKNRVTVLRAVSQPT